MEKVMMQTESTRTGNHPAGALPPLLREIAEHPFLRDLSEKYLSVLADCAMRAHFATDEQIFREGHPANRFYLVKHGKIALERTSELGRNTIQVIGANEVLGWSWLFPPFYWHFDARALEPTEAVFFYGTRLRELCEEDHDLGYELMKRTCAVVTSRLMAARQDLAARTGVS
jgi:CRP/FNR family cyclic AMP-dependent transcriptional regulator